MSYVPAGSAYGYGEGIAPAVPSGVAVAWAPTGCEPAITWQAPEESDGMCQAYRKDWERCGARPTGTGFCAGHSRSIIRALIAVGR